MTVSHPVYEFDLTPLLAPISQDEPCGFDLMYDASYERIVEFARQEDSSLPMGVWVRDVKKADWPAVATNCYQELTERTKDLQITAWLTESLFELRGWPGAVFGWQVFIQLAQTYWNDIYPRMVDDDVDLRLKPVHWLVKKTTIWMAKTPVLANSSDDLPHSILSLEELVKTLRTLLGNQLGDRAPSLHDIQSQLDQIKGKLNLLGRNDMSSNGSNAAQSPQLSKQSREAAYADLAAIAAYLASIEPHSPVPMILKTLANWQDCSFSDLIERLPEGQTSIYQLNQFFKSA